MDEIWKVHKACHLEQLQACKKFHTQRVCNAIAVSLGMQHVTLRFHDEVMNHLDCFRILNMNMFFVANRLHEVLMNELSDHAPSLPIIHHQKVITLSDQAGYKGRGPVTVNIAFLIEQISDEFAI